MIAADDYDGDEGLKDRRGALVYGQPLVELVLGLGH